MCVPTFEPDLIMTRRGTALFVEWNYFLRCSWFPSSAAREGEETKGSESTKAFAATKCVVVLGPRRLISKELALHPKPGGGGCPWGGLWALHEVPQGEESVDQCSRCLSAALRVRVPLKSELAPFLLSVVL